MPHETRRIPLSTPFGRQVGSRVSIRGPLLSAVAHAAVIFLLLYSARRGAEALAAGQGPGRGGGGGGGGNRQYTVVMQAPAAARPAPPAVVPPKETPQLVVPKVVQPLDSIVQPSSPAAAQQPAAAGPGSGAGAGPGSGTGTGGGTGSGTGPGVGGGVGPDSGGAGGNVFPPQPSTILPPIFDHVPGDLKGVRITVRFDVSERGEILGIDVDPPIRDRGFRGQFMEKMRRYVFTSAIDRAGRRVRGTATLYFTL